MLKSETMNNDETETAPPENPERNKTPGGPAASAVKQPAVDERVLNRQSAKLNIEDEKACIRVRNLNLFYGEDQALKDINMIVPEKRVTAFIGPSGCGKSTLLRCFNRMNDLIDNVRTTGEINIQGENIVKPSVNVAELRRNVGMVFQKPNPFPKSVYENVAYGLRIQGINDRRTLDAVVEESLKGAALWDEVKDRLNDNALGLS